MEGVEPGCITELGTRRTRIGETGETEVCSELPLSFRILRIWLTSLANWVREASPGLVSSESRVLTLRQKAGSLTRSGETSGNSEDTHLINFLTTRFSY